MSIRSIRSLRSVVAQRELPWFAFLLLSLLICSIGSPVGAADKQDAKPSEEEPPPEPEDHEVLSTNRQLGAQLVMAMRFYPGTEGEDSVPIIIIHDWNQQGVDYDEFALMLQSKGHAVAVPDLRGHGESTLMKSADGTSKKLTPGRLHTNDLRNMVRYDLQAVKDFLMERHNDRELNIEKLCLVGVGRGCIFAMNFALWDWHWPELLIKNGRDVDALVLISPQLTANGLGIEKPLSDRNIRSALSVMIVFGDQDKRSLKNAERINSRFARYHEVDEDTPLAQKSLHFVRKETNLQDFKLLTEPELEVGATVAAFVQIRLVDKKVPWRARRRNN